MKPVDLYLIRHGLAGDRGTHANDDQRPLTDEGHRRTQQVAKRLYGLEVGFDLILTSPLVRARQTAEILLKVGLSEDLQESSQLAPDGSLADWLSWLEPWRQSGRTSLALVGHEPSLSNWATELVWGESGKKLILKKAGIIGLTLPDSGSPVGRSHLFWLTPPRFLV